MRPAPRAAVAACVLLVALVLQLTLLSRLPTTGRPDVVLVAVVALALVGGSTDGALAGFAGGLALDAWGDHPLGSLALTFTVVGYLAGLLVGEADRSIVVPLATVAVASVVAGLVYVGISAVLGDPRVGLAPLLRSLPGAVVYDVVLAPLVVPVVLGAHARLSGRSRLG